MPPITSRKGRQIASRACDLCRDRKVQCMFGEEAASCQRCLKNGYRCTFLKNRKARGPVPQRNASVMSLPVGDLSIEHLCSRDIFLMIIADYLEIVYPLLPLVHRPSFQTLLESDALSRDPAFFRLCVALCAVTIASMPKSFEKYGGGNYNDIGAMVDRACHIVVMSRVMAEPQWQSRPSTATMLVSIILTMASHYAGKPNQGWGYASEAIQVCRSLELYRRERHQLLGLVDSELCKRGFWVLYIIQTHDRLSSIVPHTGLVSDLVHTDWEYLLPSEMDDVKMTADACGQAVPPSDEFQGSGPPLISGFIALVKVFLCVADLLSYGFPGSAPHAYAMTGGPRLEATLSNAESEACNANVPPRLMSMTYFFRIIKSLQATIEKLPSHLRLSQSDEPLHFSCQTEASCASIAHQFDIMRANIHITSLYLQSTILESCSNTFASSPFETFAASPGDDAAAGPHHSPRTQLWNFRESIARELLEVLNFCSPSTLEANGSSMIVKIREVAATLLNDENDIGVTSQREEQSRRYVVQFAEILAELDLMGQSTVIPAIFSTHWNS